MLLAIDAPEKQDRLALIEASTGRSWSYKQLAENIERRRASFEPSEAGVCFLFCVNGLDAVAWYLAAIEAGHAVALLDSRLDAGLRERLVSLYVPDWIVGLNDEAMISYQRGDDGLLRPDASCRSPVFSGLSVLLSTSGTTGSPKFVRLTRGNIEANAQSIATALGITPHDRPVAHLPLYYSYGLSVVNSHLWAGSTILLMDKGIVTKEFWDAIRQHRINSFSGVPHTYQMLRRLDLNSLDVPLLRTMTQAGGKLDNANVAFFSEAMRGRGGGFWTMYGQTEATARIAILPPPELPSRLGLAGRAIPGGRLCILTEGGEYKTTAGVEGELVYDGPNVMLGYAQERADLVRGDELRGRLHTGDRAVLDGEGFVRILGRVNRDAKIFGLRINLDDVETLIRPKGPTAVIAGEGRVIVFCEFGDQEQYGTLGAELSVKLNVHRSAFEFRRIDQLPIKETGKIAYEVLQNLL